MSIARDVDCGGGSGNGPAYVIGTVYVIGTEVYDLDRDGDGVGCDGGSEPRFSQALCGPLLVKIVAHEYAFFRGREVP